MSLILISCFIAVYADCDKFVGEGWEMVRHVNKRDVSFFAANDSLSGTTAAFGSPSNPSSDSDPTWNVEFGQRDFNEFLFATGDCLHYLVADKQEVIASYETKVLHVKRSSLHTTPHSVNRISSNIQISEPNTVIKPGRKRGGVIYSEMSSTSGPEGELLRRHGGLNLFIRKSSHCDGMVHNNWKMVRHLNSKDSTFYRTTDKALGTSPSFGSPSSPPQLNDESWNTQFSDLPFSEYLFSTGDCQHYMVVDRSVLSSKGVTLPVRSSSAEVNQYTVLRSQNAFVMSLFHYWPDGQQYSGILYAEDDLVLDHTNSNYLRSHNGLTVWVR
eukprot:TRINITY_DN2173_c4_g1_i1.p1 TRINITY_DN2173_c4_g1~~TRINITY_DN2173_c4_g1_i1.p1  ORF type:complete len:328 (+),score=39.29 TRINITY_DN2173_c4_g1_i1:55-1038(+)